MSRVMEIEHQVRQLSADELADFRAWYSAFDADDWDRSLEHDAASGKLDRFADKALRDHAAAASKPL